MKNAHVNAKSFINGMRNLVRVLVNGVNGGGGMMDELVLVMVPGEQQEGGEGSTSVGDVAASVARNAAR